MQEIVTLEANGKKVTVSAEDFENAAKGEVPEQMIFDFGPQYSDIAIKEAVRGVRVIAKEAIRFGADKRAVSLILRILADENEIVYAAANAIEEAL